MKKILFVVDKPNWAYEFMVMSWLPYLLKDYECYVVYQEDLLIKRVNKSSLYKLLYNTFIENEGRKIHKDGFFYSTNFEVYKYLNSDGQKELIKTKPNKFNIIIEMAFYFQYTAYLPFNSDKKIVGIFTDSFPHDGPTFDVKNNVDRRLYNRQEFFENYLKSYDHIFVGGGNLYKDYCEITDKVSFVYGIYGEDKFIENSNVGLNENFVIGWTGNPNREMKGFKEFIEPAIIELKELGYKIDLKTKFSGPYDDLFSFYEDVDLVVIASSADSGPSMYAEACLSSVPVISTKIGLPLMGIENNINGLFIERSKESIKEAIIKLYNDRELLNSYSKRVKTDYLKKLGNNNSVKNVLKNLQ